MLIYRYLNLFAIKKFKRTNIWNNCFDFFSSWDILTTIRSIYESYSTQNQS